LGLSEGGTVARTRREYRDLSGILILDKSLGISSNQALQRVRHLFAARKAGHTGSLDPLATGVLPICFGEATKLSGFLLDAAKRYRVTIQLGVTTTTGDTEGAVLLRRAVPNLEATAIETALGALTGEILQVPPMYSALKHQGQRLYRLAHQGIDVPRPARAVTVYEAVLHGIDATRLDVEFHCSKGTYVRTLAEDLGQALGCGAHVATLRRVAAGAFAIDQAWTLDALQDLATTGGRQRLDALLLPLDCALADWPEAQLTAEAAFFVLRGQAVRVTGVARSGWVKLRGPEGRLLGVGVVAEDGRVHPKRMFNQ
jgi:tRNA pseudouridine55 synthase